MSNAAVYCRRMETGALITHRNTSNKYMHVHTHRYMHCIVCFVRRYILNLFFFRFCQAFEEQNILTLDLTVWILIIFLLILPSTFIRRPDFLGWWSLIANIIEVITIISLFINIFSSSSSWKVQTSVNWSKIPLTIGIAFYVFEIAPFVSYINIFF